MKLRILLGLGALAASSAAYAGPYLGGSFALTERGSYENVDRADGNKITLGYRFDDTPLMLEVAYMDAGDAEVPDQGVILGYTGFSATVNWWARASETGSGFWIGGGFYSGDAELTDMFGGGTLAKESASGAVITLGGVWKFSRHVGLQFSLDGLLGMTDFAEDENLTAYTVGLVIELPGGTKKAPPRYTPSSYPQPAPAAYTPPPAPAYTPPPAPEPMPVAPVAAEPAPLSAAPVAPAPVAAPQPTTIPADLPGGMAAIGVRLTAQPTMLLRQPRSGAPVDGNLPAGAEVQLLQRVPNAQGVWWYVSYNGTTGWVSERALK